MGTLSITNLSAGYGEQTVVRGIDFSVAAGEVVALMGRNGVGKTTTLLGAAGYLPSTTGEVRVDGDLMKGPAHARTNMGLGIVLEGRCVFPSLSMRKNFEVASAPIEPALNWFPELKRMIDRPVGTLSGGEQQMVALGRALSRKPSALLVDELSFGLAPIVCRRLLELVRQIAAEESTAIVVVEQHLELAVEVVDRALIMSGGRTVLELAGAELASRAQDIEEVYLGGPSLDADQPLDAEAVTEMQIARGL